MRVEWSNHSAILVLMYSKRYAVAGVYVGLPYCVVSLFAVMFTCVLQCWEGQCARIQTPGHVHVQGTELSVVTLQTKSSSTHNYTLNKGH